MKIIVVMIALIGVAPLALLIRRSRRIADAAWICIGFLPFLLPALPQVDIALANFEGWIGYVHGIEVTVIDFLALALLLALPGKRGVLNFHIPLAFYLFALLLAMTQAAHPLAASFVVFQFMKVYLLVVVVARGCMNDERVPVLLMKGLAIGLGIQLVAVIQQVASGEFVQPPGTFWHQNTLGMVIHMVALPHFALFLAGARGIQFVAVPPAALLVASLTASRATVALCILGFALTYVLSLVRRFSARKAAIGAVGLLAVLMLIPVAISSFDRRFEETPLQDDKYDERAAFNRAAGLILSDFPMGVGPNHYVYIGKNLGYSLKAGVAPFEDNLSNIVHNAYLLAAAETGYIGLAAFVILLIYPLVIALWYVPLSARAPTGDLLLGLAAALLTVYVHSIYEYILFGKDVQYVFAVTIGTIFGVASRVALLNKSRRQQTTNRLSGARLAA